MQLLHRKKLWPKGEDPQKLTQMKAPLKNNIWVTIWLTTEFYSHKTSQLPQWEPLLSTLQDSCETSSECFNVDKAGYLSSTTTKHNISSLSHNCVFRKCLSLLSKNKHISEGFIHFVLISIFLWVELYGTQSLPLASLKICFISFFDGLILLAKKV